MGQDAADLQAKNVNDLLREGVAAAKSGQRERARDLLMHVVDQDEQNVLAWLWLSGVVDSLEDREICLENVLALDPDNAAARRGLRWVREQKNLQALPPAETVSSADAVPESPVLARARTFVSPAAAMLHEDFARQQPLSQPEPEPPPSIVRDEFDNEYLCPYCATPTEPDDRKCRACGGKLWISFRKQEERSTWLWIALSLQAINTLPSAVVSLVLASILFGSEGGELFVEVYAGLFGLSSATIETWLHAALVVALLFFLFSLAVLIGLYVRWKPAFYLYLINAVLGLIRVIVDVVRFLSSPESALFGGSSYGCSGLTLLVTLGMLWLAFQIKDDFPFERRRIVLHVDRGSGSSTDFMIKGDFYAKRKMWAMAAIHLRRAVALTPNQLDCRMALAVAYTNLKRYDLAAQSLAEARRISPGNARVEKLQALLDEMRSTGDSL